MRQERSIKRDIKLPVAFHDVQDVSVLVALLPGGRGRGTPGNSWWGCAAQFRLIFPIRFQTRPLKSVSISDLAFRQKVHRLLRLERKQKNSSSPFQIRTFIFLSYSFGIETITSYTVYNFCCCV